MRTTSEKGGRLLYVLEAAFEYFYTLLVGGAFLAKTTQYLGLSDSLTGILTSAASLGCVFQLFAVFTAGKSPVKRRVIAVHILNQTCFCLVYLVPVVRLPHRAAVLLFMLFVVSGYAVNNIINPPKTNWFMGLVDEHKRGEFTAVKEMVSLVGGMLFSFLMGLAVDHYEAKGDLRLAFVFMAAVCFGLMILHTLTLVFMPEKETPKTDKISARDTLHALFSGRRIRTVVALSCLWGIAYNFCVPFFGAYQVGALGLSLVEVSVIGMVTAVVRTAASPLLGRWGDRQSFSGLFAFCFAAEAAALLCIAFTVPANGRAMFLLYSVLTAVPQAGVGNAQLNLVYSEVSPSLRVGALALQNAFTGALSFLSTLAAGLLVDRIREAGNSFFGHPVYVQQVLAMIGVLLSLLSLLYYLTVGRKVFGRRAETDPPTEQP